MIRAVRRALRRHKKYYSVAAAFYHAAKNKWMHLTLMLRGVTYLTPMRLGGVYCSQYGQDYYLEKLGLISKGGFFVEVGCNHPKHNSNSYFLEQQYGFSGISIDAIDYSNEFALERPRTKFVRALVDTAVGQRDFYHVVDEEGWENQVSSVYKKSLTMGKGFDAEVVQIQTVLLSSLIKKEQIIDVMLIDVEGHEFSVLNSLNWRIHKPKVIVVENNGEFYCRKMMERYMTGKGYQLVARIGTSDDIYKIAD